MKFRSTIFLLALVLLVGCSGNSMYTNEYENDKFGITLNYPVEWYISDIIEEYEDSQNIAIYLSSEPFKPYLGIQEFLVTVLGFNPADDEYIHSFIQRFYLDGGEVLNTTKTTINSQESIKTELIMKDEMDEEIKAIVYSVALDGRSFMISFQYRNGFEDQMDVFYKIVESIKFSD